MLRKTPLALLILLLSLVSCTGDVPIIRDSNDPVTLTPMPSPTQQPTTIPVGAEGVGATFYQAWETGDYIGMYSLLSPQSQALIDGQAFADRYRESLAIATVQRVLAKPMSSLQENNRVQMLVEVIWETSVVGSIVRNHEVELVFNGGRWGIVWHEGLILPELEGGFRLALEYQIPARANIYDRNGAALAFQGTVLTLGVVPGRIEDETVLLDVLSGILGKRAEDIQSVYASALPDWFVPLGEVTREQVEANFETLNPYVQNGTLVTQERLTRLYSDNGVAPHIVGFTQPIPQEELAVYQAQGFRGDEIVGRTGVEAWGEDYLNGERGGELWVVSTTGEYISTVQAVEPQQARSIFLTIEREYQGEVEQALAQAMLTHPVGQRAAVVVIDVNSGAILAMASYPDFHPNIFDFSRPDSAAELNAILNNPNDPLFNKAAQGTYPPGSVFKILTMAAGLDSGLFGTETPYFCTGEWVGLGEALIKFDWLEGGHGSLNHRQALTRSCNPYFYEVGFQVGQVDPFLLPNVARQFGLGLPTGIQGISESGGIMPDPEWKIAALGEGWSLGDSVNMAIGQGFVEVSPLQVANMIAAVANGGTLYQPYIIQRIGAGAGAPEESWPVQTVRQITIDPAFMDAIRGSMNNVTSGDFGTAAHRFGGMPVPTAGKTGTAENVGESHAWFAGYAPYGTYTPPNGTPINNPEIAVAVIAENAGEGSAVAAPIFRRIVELYYNITPLTPFPWE